MDQISLDNRGLPPPEPMVRALRALEDLVDGQELVVFMDREPFILYRELQRRGFEWEFEEAGRVLTIRRAIGLD
ncbi:MAG: DUF2249 domain-containing protein [bacterium]